jgi:hypothetical protein
VVLIVSERAWEEVVVDGIDGDSWMELAEMSWKLVFILSRASSGAVGLGAAKPGEIVRPFAPWAVFLEDSARSHSVETVLEREDSGVIVVRRDCSRWRGLE